MEFYKLCIVLQILLIASSRTGFCSPTSSTKSDRTDLQEDDYDDDGNTSDQNISPQENSIPLAVPHFQKSEDRVIATLWDQATLKCLIDNMEARHAIMWKNGSDFITQGSIVISQFQSSRIQLEDKSRSLILNHVQLEDENTYTCVVFPHNLGMKVILEIKRPIAIIYADDGRELNDRSITYNEGQRIEIKCVGISKVPIKIKWFFESNEIVADKNIEIADGRLIVSNPNYNNEGLYRCLVDPGGNGDVAHASVTINIEYKPIVKTHRHIVNTIENDKAGLHCHYRSFLPTKVTWQKDNNVISATEEQYVDQKYLITEEKKAANQNESILKVYQIKQNDLGDYQCIVQNPLGEEKVTIHLTYSPEQPHLEKAEVVNRTIITHWKIHSIQPLTEIQLSYQLKGSKEWIDIKSIDHEKSMEHLGVWKVKHRFEVKNTGIWQARIKAKNIFDWSVYSNEETIIVPEQKNDTSASNINSVYSNEETIIVPKQKNDTSASNINSISSVIYLVMFLLLIPQCFQ